MEPSWHFTFREGFGGRTIGNTLIIKNDCNIHHNIEYKNLKKLEAHLIDVFPKCRFELTHVQPTLTIHGGIYRDDIDKIKIVIGKNKFCKPATRYIATKPSYAWYACFFGRWGKNPPPIVFERRPQFYN